MDEREVWCGVMVGCDVMMTGGVTLTVSVGERTQQWQGVLVLGLQLLM